MMYLVFEVWRCSSVLDIPPYPHLTVDTLSGSSFKLTLIFSVAWPGIGLMPLYNADKNSSVFVSIFGGECFFSLLLVASVKPDLASFVFSLC